MAKYRLDGPDYGSIDSVLDPQQRYVRQVALPQILLIDVVIDIDGLAASVSALGRAVRDGGAVVLAGWIV
ncbi:MAG TPA: hypothetical protein VMY43_03640 [Methanothrix sp.]|nr:hypothetical protein [Methanothrix sp.]